jgi:hypothetical protein
MRFLPPEDQAIVCLAQELGLTGASPSPAYLRPEWCTGLSLALAIPTLGYSLIVVPILWVAQHDRTLRRLAHLRGQLETDPHRNSPGRKSGVVRRDPEPPIRMIRRQPQCSQTEPPRHR